METAGLKAGGALQSYGRANKQDMLSLQAIHLPR